MKYDLSMNDLPNEEWKDIQGFEGYYQISNMGRIKSLKRTRKLNNEHRAIVNPRIIKPSISNAGYSTVILRKEGIPYGYTIHRLVMKNFCDDFDPTLDTDHINKDKQDNRLENLRQVTHHYNTQLARHNHPNISVDMFDLNDNYICSFKSVKQAATKTGIPYNKLNEHINSGKPIKCDYIFKKK